MFIYFNTCMYVHVNIICLTVYSVELNTYMCILAKYIHVHVYNIHMYVFSSTE